MYLITSSLHRSGFYPRLIPGFFCPANHGILHTVCADWVFVQAGIRPKSSEADWKKSDRVVHVGRYLSVEYDGSLQICSTLLLSFSFPFASLIFPPSRSCFTPLLIFLTITYRVFRYSRALVPFATRISCSSKSRSKDFEAPKLLYVRSGMLLLRAESIESLNSKDSRKLGGKNAFGRLFD